MGIAVIDDRYENRFSHPNLFKQLLRDHAHYSRHSHLEARDNHLPRLRSSSQPHIDTVLLGDNPHNDLGAAISTASRAAGKSPSTDALHNVFKAGAENDTYQNILYRLVGDQTPGRELDGLLDHLPHQPVKLWVLSAGTNNLHRTRGLPDSAVKLLRLTIQALLWRSNPESVIYVTGIFYRRDMPDHLVDEANGKIRALVNSINAGLENMERQRIFFLPAPMKRSDKSFWLRDHKNLSPVGYTAWIGVLWPVMIKALNTVDAGIAGRDIDPRLVRSDPFYRTRHRDG
ncbi:SGNH hydrolase-type esterase domain-containing protein [Hypoxylon sp. NC1633]|nr:SGNH hydrolase-type esterase domain-containing protein [Hypoxylon sp. NC1633]